MILATLGSDVKTCCLIEVPAGSPNPWSCVLRRWAKTIFGEPMASHTFCFDDLKYRRCFFFSFELARNRCFFFLFSWVCTVVKLWPFFSCLEPKPKRTRRSHLVGFANQVSFHWRSKMRMLRKINTFPGQITESCSLHGFGRWHCGDMGEISDSGGDSVGIQDQTASRRQP